MTTKSAIIESVVVQGDLAKLSADERVKYYMAVCDSIGLNPLTKPFDYIRLNNKLTLYAKKDATDQLREKHKISVDKPDTEVINDVFVATVTASTPEGRTDTDIGAVNINGLKGDKLANALMKAVTKSKRRVTLSICGLGFLDESEIETIPDAEVIEGEILETEKPMAASISLEASKQYKTSRKESPEPTNGDRPYSPEVLRNRLFEIADNLKPFDPSDAQRNLLRYCLESLFTGDPNIEDKRHTLLGYLAESTSTKEVSGEMFKAIVEKWCGFRQDKDTEDYFINDSYAVQEAQAVVAQEMEL